MRVELSEDTERDLLDGIAFYDQIDRRAGDHFFESMTTDLKSLLLLGGVHPKRHGYYFMPASRFPFAIYSTVNLEAILVVAILDERRDPAWIAGRLKNE